MQYLRRFLAEQQFESRYEGGNIGITDREGGFRDAGAHAEMLECGLQLERLAPLPKREASVFDEESRCRPFCQRATAANRASVSLQQGSAISLVRDTPQSHVRMLRQGHIGSLQVGKTVEQHLYQTRGRPLDRVITTELRRGDQQLVCQSIDRNDPRRVGYSDKTWLDIAGRQFQARQRQFIRPCSELLDVMSSAHRLAILTILVDNEMSVGSLGKSIGLSPSAVSQQLGKLRGAGLVAFRRRAQTVFYRCDSDRVKQILVRLAKLFPE